MNIKSEEPFSTIQVEKLLSIPQQFYNNEVNQNRNH